MLELLEGFAQRRPIDAQSLGQLTLGWQLRPGRVLAVQDEAAQLFGNLLGYALLLDRLEHQPNEVNPPGPPVEDLEAPAGGMVPPR